MNWYKHDTDALSDAKVKKLILKYGTDGYAVYFHCLELIAGDIKETNLTFELEHDSEIIADNLKIKGTPQQSGIDRVNEIMRYIVDVGLFDESNNKIFCFKLLKRLDLSMTSSTKLRELISFAKENHDKVMIRHDKVMQEEKRIEEIKIKENRREENEGCDKSPPTPIKKESKRFIPPTLEEVKNEMASLNHLEEAEPFYYHYDANGWTQGAKSKPLVSWKSAARSWLIRSRKFAPAKKELPVHRRTTSLDMEGM